MNLLRILMWTYGSGEVELMEEGTTSSGGMVGARAHDEVDPWRGGRGRGRWRGQRPRWDVGAAAAAGSGRDGHGWS